MANPYAAGGSAAATISTVRGNAGAGEGPNQGMDVSGYRVGTVLRRVMRYVGPHLPLLVVAFVTAAASVVLQLYVPVLIGNAIDCMVAAGRVDFARLAPILQRLAIVVAAAGACQWVQGYCTNRLSYNTARDLRVDAYGKLDRLPLSFVDSHSHGDLLSRVINDVDQVSDGLLQGFTQLFNGVATIVGTIAFMLSISVPVALVVILLTPLSVLAAGIITRKSAASFAAQQALQGELGGFAEEVIGNQKLVTAFAHAPADVATFGRVNAQLYEKGVHAQFISSLSNPSTRLVNNITYAAVAIAGCASVITGWPTPLTVGQVQSFLSYANQYMKPFNEISAVVTQVQTAFASARRLLALMDAAEEEPDAPGAKALDAPRGELELDHVCFSYTKDHPLLQDVCIHVPAGKRFALVGPTGCGKTTLINLLMRFYDADSGDIRIDGTSIYDCSRRSLRKNFGMVLQDTWLHAGTIRENIAFGKPDATDEEIIQAAKEARSWEFIRRMPEGLDTVVTDDSLSAGQKQLLCITRVMLVLPPMLILDEATSSIDTRTEILIQNAFDRMMKGRTSFVVAHRLSTIRNADIILVMKDGKIIEQGNHESLMAANGFYTKLYNAQFAKAE